MYTFINVASMWTICAYIAWSHNNSTLSSSKENETKKKKPNAIRP